MQVTTKVLYLWSDRALNGYPDAVLLALQERRIGDFIDHIDFRPLADRRITGLLGGIMPYGIAFETDHVDTDIPMPGGRGT